ncbi:MAG: oligosaccharide flippase family protein [Lachnospiraceae bacterium]|nr:oligosaccharide flippase family protein [Lachnospiraceae bacterium]
MGKVPETSQKGLLGQFLSFFYGNFAVLLLGFIQTPMVTRLMSASEYGRTGLFESVVSIIYIFALLGLDQSFIRYYYEDKVDRQGLILTCLKSSLCLVTGILIFYFLFSEKINHLLFERSGADITALVVGYAIISVFERFLILEVRMERNGVLYSNINIAEKLLNILFILLFFKILGDDFRVVLYALVLSWGSTTVFMGIRHLSRTRPRDPAVQRINIPLKELLTYGLPFVLALLLEWMLGSMDRVSLRALSSYDELGIYSAAMKIMVILLTFKNSFVAFWAPVALKRYETDTLDGCKDFYRKVFDLALFAAVLGAVALIVFRKLVVLILGSSYRGAERMIPFLSLMPIFAILFEITNMGLKIRKKNIYLNVASAAAIFFNLLGNACLIPLMGGSGAALSTGVSYFVYFILGSIFSERVFRVGYRWGRTLFAALAMVTLGVIAYFFGSSLYGEICVVAFCLILVAIFLYLSWRQIKDMALFYIKKK